MSLLLLWLLLLGLLLWLRLLEGLRLRLGSWRSLTLMAHCRMWAHWTLLRL